MMGRKRNASDPVIPDVARCGDDLLARIDELTEGKIPEDCDGNGWRCVLKAAGAEIGRLRGQLLGIAHRIENAEERRRS